MVSTSQRRGRLLPAVALATQLGAGVLGVWLLNDLGRRYDEGARGRVKRLDAMTDLHLALTDAERMALVAVIQGDRLHPNVSAAFRGSVERAREACRAGRVDVDFAGERAEADQLAGWVEEAARRGEVLLAAPPGDRLALYSEPGAGFQTAATSAWRHMSNVRILNEVLLGEAGASARTAGQRAAWQFGGVSGLSLALSVLAWWQWRRPARPAVGPAVAVEDLQGQ